MALSHFLYIFSIILFERHSVVETMILTCTICCDDLEPESLYCCKTTDCKYKRCTPCIKLAFEDASGDSYKRCPMCNSQMGARDLLDGVLGKGAVVAVENEVRPRIEYDLKTHAELRERKKKYMGKYNDKARVFFNELSELLNMKCPRCKQVFDDYSGCNALTCSNPSCRAQFCAVCLEDCQTDAHPHVRQAHGDLFDKSAFQNAKKAREKATLESFMSKLNDEPFEVKQLVKNMYMQSYGASKSSDGRNIERLFLDDAKEQLKQAVRSDRLGVLQYSDSKDFRRRGLEFDDISPRCLVPGEYKLEIVPLEANIYQVRLYRRDGVTVLGDTQWVKENLEDFQEETEKQSDRRQVDSLVNVVLSLKCSVIAISGAFSLYQTRSVSVKKENDKIAIILCRVNADGEVEDEPAPLGLSRIIGINQNQRFLLLERHVTASGSKLIFDPLRDFIGVHKPSKVFDNIIVPAPGTFMDLNDQQQKVAHPLALKTAVECAGPPGSGKTKTITELIRGLLECSTANIVVLSERNGAIDAIAEKFVQRCLKKRKGQPSDILDIPMWNNLLVFGSQNGLGPSAKLLTLEEKLKYVVISLRLLIYYHFVFSHVYIDILICFTGTTQSLWSCAIRKAQKMKKQRSWTKLWLAISVKNSLISRGISQHRPYIIEQ
jgi:phage FluMu protein Com